MKIIAHKLCSIQGRLFELSARQGFASDEFVKAYMNSEVAAKFNSAYDRYQWMGEEYLLEELIQTYCLKKGELYSSDIMFWMGYTYAHWSIVYGDSCKNIIKMAGPRVMFENYAGLHTVSTDLAIQDLKAQYWSHGNSGAKLRDEVVMQSKGIPCFNFILIDTVWKVASFEQENLVEVVDNFLLDLSQETIQTIIFENEYSGKSIETMGIKELKI